MSDTVTTVRPNGTVATNGWTASATTLHGDTSDNDDTTYIATPGGDAVCQLDMGTFTVPDRAVIHGVTVRVRASDTGLLQQIVLLYDATALISERTVPMTASIVTYQLTTQPRSPSGAAWDQASIDAIRVGLANDTFSAAHVREVYVDVTYNQAPVATAVAPAGTVTDTNQPTFSWTYADAEGDGQERVRVKMFRTAQADPDHPTETPLWDSGPVLTNATTMVSGVAVANHQTVYWYVKAADAGSGGRYGPWDGETFTPNIDPIGVPTLSVPYPDTAIAAISDLNVKTRHNLHTRDTSTLEGGVGSWSAVSFCTVASSTDQAFRGTHSLKVTAVTPAGDVTAASGYLPAVEGELYTSMFCSRPATTAREVTMNLIFYDNTPTEIGRAVADGWEVAGAWTRFFVSARCPDGATQFRVGPHWIGAADTEVHYLDAQATRAGVTSVVDNGEFDEGGAMWALSSAGIGIAEMRTSDHWTFDGAGEDGQCVRLAMRDANTAALGPAALSGSVYWFGLQEAETYIVSAWFRKISRRAGAYDAMIELVYSDGLNTAQKAITDLSGSWEQRVLVCTVPAGKTAGRVRISAGDRYNAAALAEVYVDAVQVQRVGPGLANGGFETGAVDNVARQDGFDGKGWSAANLAADVTRDVGTVHAGGHSLKMSRPPGDPVTGKGIRVTQDVYVVGSTSVTVDFWWRLVNVNRSEAKVSFYGVARQPVVVPAGWASAVGLTSDQTYVYVAPSSGASGDSGWVHKGPVTVQIPAGTVWVEIQFEGGWSDDDVNPGITYVDDVTVNFDGTQTAAPFTPGGWTTGGLTDLAVFVDRSDDGGLTWAPLRWPQGSPVRYLFAPAGQPVATPWVTGTVDYEAPFKPVLYRAALAATSNGHTVRSNPWIYPAPVELAVTDAWMKDPTDPASNLLVPCLSIGMASVSTEPQVVDKPIGRSTWIVAGDVPSGEVIALDLTFNTDAEWDEFEALRREGRTILFQSGFGDGLGDAEQYYVRLGSQRSVTRVIADRNVGLALRSVQMQALEVAPPP